MPILRTEITSFVRTWNNHSIRKQKLRPHLVYGKPYMNYHYPADGVQDHGLKFDQNLLRTLQEDVAEWGKSLSTLPNKDISTNSYRTTDSDEYLPQVTYDWVTRQLQEMNFDPMAPILPPNGDVFAPHREVYMELRTRILTHIEQQLEPVLYLSTRPTGAFDWNPGQEIEEVQVADEANDE
jgi:hypothetical protein